MDGTPAAPTPTRLPGTAGVAFRTFRCTVDHAMAAGAAGRVYVVGGYGPGSVALGTGFVFRQGRWTPLPPMPAPRAAAGAAILGGKLYVVGGVEAPGRLARDAFTFDLQTARWATIRGPRPREHLGAAALGGLVYAVAGRTAGLDSNLDVVEAFDPRRGRWRAIARVPGKRGGTAAAAVAGRLVSAGGEEPTGTIPTVYAYSPGTRRWRAASEHADDRATGSGSSGGGGASMRSPEARSPASP